MISLELPADFNIPPLLQNTTPEENAMILLASVPLVERMRASDFESRLNTVKAELEQEKNRHETMRTTLRDLNSIVHESVTEAVETNLQGIDQRLAGLTKTLFDEDKATREASEKRLAGEREKLERRVADIDRALNRVNELVSTKQTSTTKGQIGENWSNQVIIDSFASHGVPFCMHDKKHCSGDHIFDWNGIKIMWEDKNYTFKVPYEQVEKALRDFDANMDCNVLLVVSFNTPISRHESSSNIDAEFREGRLIIYISNFKSNADPVSYIKSIIQPILILAKPLLQQARNPNGENIEKLRMVMATFPNLIKSYADHEKSLDEFLMDIKVKVQTMKNALMRSRRIIEDLVQHAVESDDDAPDEPEEVASSKKVRKCGNCGLAGHIKTRCPSKQ
jgi:hypothetical protein